MRLTRNAADVTLAHAHDTHNPKDSAMKIQILGTGCSKCQALTDHAEQAITELGLTAEIEKIEGLAEIAGMGVMMTPALAVDGEVRSSGHLLSVHQVKTILQAESGAS